MNESPSQPLDRDEMNLYSPRLFEATKTNAAPAPRPPTPASALGAPFECRVDKAKRLSSLVAAITRT